MRFVEALDDINERHDNWEHRAWARVPIVAKVILAPILLVPYVLSEIATWFLFAVPYAALESLLDTGERK